MKARNGMRQSFAQRRGALTVEASIVMPVMMLLMLMIIVGGYGVFLYEQTALLACEAARWASVRGQSAQPPTQQQILQNAVLPMATSMDPRNISIQVQLIMERPAWQLPGTAPVRDRTR